MQHIFGSALVQQPLDLCRSGILCGWSGTARSTNPLAQRKWRTHETFRLQIGCLGYNISTQARSRYSSLAAVLGSKTPRQVPAVLKYLLMISVISLQPIFTLLCFVLFVSESTTLCLSPHPKPCPALTGSGTLSVVNINSLATCQDRRRYITGYKNWAWIMYSYTHL